MPKQRSQGQVDPRSLMVRVNTAKKAKSNRGKHLLSSLGLCSSHRHTHKTMPYTTYKYKEKLLINMRSKLQEKLKPTVPLNRKLCQEELAEARGDVTANHCEMRS